MEVGLEPWMLSTGRDREGDPEARLQVVVVDGETSMSQASGVVDVEVTNMRRLDVIRFELQISADEAAAAAASEPRRNATERTALAVAATAAVELTNLFFLLRGGGTERRRCGRIEGISTLFAFAAFLSAAGLLIVRNAARRRLVVLVASAAALFVAAAGTVLSLLRVQGSR